ncbi:MAG TPA: DUF302 domain-containing protein [Caulobacteraceae bacterium]|jgi:uncharacterized protein (DUF302 family)
MTHPQDPEIVEVQSAYAFAPTLDRLTAAIEGAGITIFARIDHAAGAQSVGTPMPPAVVLIYGAAKGGTPIMLAAPQAALDLPLRVLVREAEDGVVLVAFHPVAAMLRRAGVPDALAIRLDPAQHLLVEAVKA